MESDSVRMESDDLVRMTRVLRHRLRNFASGVRNAASVLSEESRDLLSPSLQEYFPLIRRECDRLGELTDRIQLLFGSYSYEQNGASGQEDVGMVVENTIDDLRGRFPDADVICRIDNGARGASLNRPDFLSTALMELLCNAVEANRRSPVFIGASIDSERLLLTITDEGSGIPGSDQEKSFLPFFTTKSRHIGIGLPIAERYVSGLRGSIELKCGKNGSGTKAEISVPMGVIND